MKFNSIIAALLLAVGMLALGLCVRSGLTGIKDKDRTVEVRGLAEREVRADHVTWPIAFSLSGNNLPAVYDNVAQTNDKIVAFLKENGIPESEISVGAPAMTDHKNDYNYKPGVTPPYSITSVVSVSSTQVEKVRQLVLRQGDLLKMGIPVKASDYSNAITYDFNGLNEIKPEMIAEATKNAREAALKFADDSDSRIGKISSARQGQFTITDRDSNTPYIKVVRVVTSLVYFLED